MKELVERVEELSGQNLYSCYQCGNCSAGCMFADEMDVLPHQVIARAQEGDQSVLKTNTAWICASCFICSVRCPRGLDVAAIMEALREIDIRQKGFRKLDLRKTSLEDVPQIAITAAAHKFTW